MNYFLTTLSKRNKTNKLFGGIEKELCKTLDSSLISRAITDKDESF